MLNDTILTTAWLIQDECNRRAMQEMLIAEAVQETGVATPVRVWIGTFLVHIGGRLMTTERPATLPWRTVQVAR